MTRIGKPLEDINTAIENAGRLELYGLRKKCKCFSNHIWYCSNDWVLSEPLVGMISMRFSKLANSGGSN